MRPNPLSLLVLLAAACLFLATRSPQPSHAITIDDSFLKPLAAQVDNPDTYGEAGDLFYNRFDDLVYLTRRGNPTALAITQRVLLHEGTPGGCGCCSGGFTDAIFADGLIPPGYLEAVPRFTLKEQVELLATADARMSETVDGGI